MLWHIFENGWEDKEFIAHASTEWMRFERRSPSTPRTRWKPITGVPGEQLKRIAETFATQKPSTIIWCMGQTHHTVGTANTRASCIPVSRYPATSASRAPAPNIFAATTTFQGATDIGLDVVTLPFYYGLTEGAWKHWGRVWEIPYDDLLGQFSSKELMKHPAFR